MKKNIVKWLNGPIIDAFDEVCSDNAQQILLRNRKKKMIRLSSSLKMCWMLFLHPSFAG